MAIVNTTAFQDRTATLRAEEHRTYGGSYDIYWSVWIDEKQIYPEKDELTKQRTKASYKVARLCFDHVVKALREYIGWLRCGRCSEYKETAAPYRVDFKDSEGEDDYYLEKLCSECVLEVKDEEGTLKLTAEA